MTWDGYAKPQQIPAEFKLEEAIAATEARKRISTSGPVMVQNYLIGRKAGGGILPSV